VVRVTAVQGFAVRDGCPLERLAPLELDDLDGDDPLAHPHAPAVLLHLVLRWMLECRSRVI
jgi:hypothetical protein